MDEYLIIDIETIGTDPRKGASLACVGWATESEPPQVSESLPNLVLEKLANPKCPIISHSKYDPVFLIRAGVQVTPPYHDTMVMAHLLNENTQLDLESCVKIYTGEQMDKRLNRADKKIWFTTDEGLKLELADAWLKYPDQVMHYCQRDAASTLQLYLTLRDKMKHQGWWDEYLEEHVPFTKVLVDMELNGIPINLADAADLRTRLEKQAETQRLKLFDDLGYDINFNSPKQLRTVLFNKVWEQEVKLPITKGERDFLRKGEGQPPEFPPRFELIKVGTSYAYGTVMQKGLGIKPKVKTDSGEWSTSTPVLTVYHGDHPIVADLIAYRKTNKVIGTYLNAYEEYSYDGRLYGRFNQTGTATGRLSHSNPNLGNQPAHGELGTAIRGLFQGRLIVGDHSQLEPRLMAHCSQDPVLLDIYRGNKDIYLVTGEYIFGKKLTKEDVERQISKTLILALGYGAGAPKLAQILAINGHWTSVDRAKEYLQYLESLYKVFFEWKNGVHRQAKDLGYVKTLGGRYRRLRWAYGSTTWKVRNKADRQAVNSIIQGSAADILRRNMLAVVQAFPDLPLLNQVHDELIWEYTPEQIPDNETAAKYATMIEDICINPGYELSVPLKFEPSFCSSWAGKGGSIELPDEGIEDEAHD